eukprot:GHVU01093411.1.p2 GENE.GHVU01093411.1~~GHVU01093411.1.p2  ORF type:complete len:100 (-),score=12.92 GHVU01093411.1:86-385(-)
MLREVRRPVHRRLLGNLHGAVAAGYAGAAAADGEDELEGEETGDRRNWRECGTPWGRRGAPWDWCRGRGANRDTNDARVATADDTSFEATRQAHDSLNE